MMLDGIKAVQGCGNPAVILDALIEISTHLGRIDAGRARYLLGLALKLAQDHPKTEMLERIKQLLARLPATPPAVAVVTQ
jgi:hypothetical protein